MFVPRKGIRRGQLLPALDMLSPTRRSRELRRLLDLGVIRRATAANWMWPLVFDFIIDVATRSHADVLAEVHPGP
jgi:hypothetical protein